jgi:5-methylcytosine-specific restriction enzyme B
MENTWKETKHMLNDTSTTYNLSNYQAIFNENDTSTRCRTVLDKISPEIRAFFENFCRTNNLLTNGRFIRDYSDTLSTTFSDSRNPKYAEQKKTSNTGRKYYIALNEKIEDQEVNLLTLEFNGVDRKMYISIDSDFYPVWYLIRNGRLMPTLRQLSPHVLMYFQTEWFKKEQITIDEFESVFTNFKKQKKRPYYHFGIEFPLQSNIFKEELANYLLQILQATSPLRELFIHEKELSNQSNYILNLIADETKTEDTIQLLNHSYSLIYGEVERFQSRARRQSFSIYDKDQLITKGNFVYFEIDQLYAPNQVLCVMLEGHRHIFSNVRDLLSDEEVEWWIKKAFTTHHLDNLEITNNAMNLLAEHGIRTSGNSYYTGTYSSKLKNFKNNVSDIKKDFVIACSLFAYASKKLDLPDSLNEKINDDIGEEVSEDRYVSDFSFKGIYETIVNNQFTFSIDIIRDFHLNLTTLDDKHFVILNGISGTGKTQLCRLYANAVYGLDY